jgi:flavin-dependent dehydrogenase
MKIGIVGARLAGSHAAAMLCRLGHEVLLFDPCTTAEKACGGGITAKALLTMPWLRQQRLPYSEIRELELNTLEGRAAALPLSHPIHIFARSILDNSLRETAIGCGALFLPERALRFTPVRNGWGITTASGDTYEVGFLVGADGANSSVRAAITGKLPAEDFALALGQYLPGVYHPGKVIVVFQENGFPGYLWSFPRVDHASVGIIHRLPGARSADLRRRVAEFISRRYPDAERSQSSFYAARVPCLRRRTLVGQQVCGRNWALLGDAAGFVDALTSEGIYFALRSAEILAESVKRGDPPSFEYLWRQDFGSNLERAAAWRDFFYAGTLFLHAFTRRAVQMIKGSATVRRITDGFICGRHSYLQVRRKLLSHFPRIFAEAILTELFHSR